MASNSMEHGSTVTAPLDAGNIRLRVLLRKDGEWWIARCLEHDVAVQARALQDLQYELSRVLLAQAALDIRNERPAFYSTPPSPPSLEHEWSRGLVAVLEAPRFSSDVPLPRILFDARVVS